MTHFAQILSCMVCHSTDLPTEVDLGNHALASRFPLPNEPDPPSGPLILKSCGECGHLQLGHSIDPDEIWRPGYGYKSGINETMRDHLQDLAHSFVGLLRPNDTVIDIASNDGTLLRHLGGYFPGTQLFGIDPLGEDLEGATIIKEYFGGQVLPRAKLITTIAMFYDHPNPVGFARSVARLLRDDGVWCVEVAYAGAMWEGAWDGICHEHLGYYGARALMRVAAKAGMIPAATTWNKSNGGSIRMWFVKGIESHKPVNVSETWDLSDLRDHIAHTGKALRRCLVDLHADHKSIMILGASTKGNTLLQSCLSHEAARTMISAAVERSQDKVGRQLPGSRIPIIGEATAALAAERPDYLLVLPWHFKSSILSRYAGLRAMGTKFIFPLPTLTVE